MGLTSVVCLPTKHSYTCLDLFGLFAPSNGFQVVAGTERNQLSQRENGQFHHLIVFGSQCHSCSDGNQVSFPAQPFVDGCVLFFCELCLR